MAKREFTLEFENPNKVTFQKIHERLKIFEADSNKTKYHASPEKRVLPPQLEIKTSEISSRKKGDVDVNAIKVVIECKSHRWADAANEALQEALIAKYNAKIITEKDKLLYKFKNLFNLDGTKSGESINFGI